MSIINKVDMGLGLLRSKLTGKNFPFMVNWAVTGRCNLRCKHCYGDYGVSQNDELPLKVIKSTIDRLKSMGTKRFTIEGGEPLFRKDIDDILMHIHQKGMEQSLCSNGIFLRDHNKVVKKAVNLLVFSLDGNEENHDNLRGKKTFQKTIEAIELAKKNNINVLLFNCLVDNNIKDIDEVIQVAKEHKINITFNIAVSKIDQNESGRQQFKNDNNDLFRQAMIKIKKLKDAGDPIYYSDKNFYQTIKWDDFKKEKYWQEEIDALPFEQKKHLVPCYAGKRFIYIECNGDVYPCYAMVGTMKVKNIVKDSVQEAFEWLQKSSYCRSCYNTTLTELNLQSNLDIGAVGSVVKNLNR